MVKREIFYANPTDIKTEEKNKQLDTAIKYLVDFFGEEFREDITRKINNATYVFSKPKGTRYGRSKYVFQVHSRLLKKAFPNVKLTKNLIMDLINFIYTDLKFICSADKIHYKFILSQLTGKKEEEIDVLNLDADLKSKFEFINQQSKFSIAEWDKKNLEQLKMDELNQYLTSKTGYSLKQTAVYMMMIREDPNCYALVHHLPCGVNYDGQTTYHNIVSFPINPKNSAYIHELTHLVSNAYFKQDTGLENGRISYFNECLTEFISQEIDKKMINNNETTSQTKFDCYYSAVFPLIEDFFRKNIDTLKKLYITNNNKALEETFGPRVQNLQTDINLFFEICNKQVYFKKEISSFLEGKTLFLGKLRKDQQLRAVINRIKQDIEEIEDFLQNNNLEQ